MTRRPTDPATRARLDALRRIARMKADAALAQLAISAQGRARLTTSIEALGRAEAPLAETAADHAPGTEAAPEDPGLVAARLAHARWIDSQRRMLNQRLALVQAEYLTLRPHAQRAFGRAEVLGRLQEELSAAARRDLAKRDGTA